MSYREYSRIPGIRIIVLFHYILSKGIGCFYVAFVCINSCVFVASLRVFHGIERRVPASREP